MAIWSENRSVRVGLATKLEAPHKPDLVTLNSFQGLNCSGGELLKSRVDERAREVQYGGILI